MERFDIVVTGLDPERPRSETIEAIARRLTKSAVEIEELLLAAPAPLVRAVDEEDAQRLVSDLRAMGVRVKPQAEGPEIADPDAPPPKIQLLYWSADDEGYERPAPPPASEPPPPPSSPTVLEPEATATETPMATAETVAVPIIVKAAEWFAPGAAPPPPVPPAPPLDAKPAPPSAARFGRALEMIERPGPPRVFFAALPSTLALPTRASSLRMFVIAPALATIALLLGALCVRFDFELGPLLAAGAVAAASGLAGLLFQLSASCLAATTMGERVPTELPGRLMEDYLRPGGGLFVVLLILVTLVADASAALIAMRATMLTLGLLWSFAATYAALGFVLSAASGSAAGYVDVTRMLGLVRRAPAAMMTLVVLGGLALGGLLLGLVLLLAAAAHSASIGILLLYVAAGGLVSLALTYAAAASGALLGQLVYASAE